MLKVSVTDCCGTAYLKLFQGNLYFNRAVSKIALSRLIGGSYPRHETLLIMQRADALLGVKPWIICLRLSVENDSDRLGTILKDAEQLSARGEGIALTLNIRLHRKHIPKPTGGRDGASQLAHEVVHH